MTLVYDVYILRCESRLHVVFDCKNSLLRMCVLVALVAHVTAIDESPQPKRGSSDEWLSVTTFRQTSASSNQPCTPADYLLID